MEDIIREAAQKIVDLNQLFYVNRVGFSRGDTIDSREYIEGLYEALEQLAQRANEVSTQPPHIQ